MGSEMCIRDRYKVEIWFQMTDRYGGSWVREKVEWLNDVNEVGLIWQDAEPSTAGLFTRGVLTMEEYYWDYQDREWQPMDYI